MYGKGSLSPFQNSFRFGYATKIDFVGYHKRLKSEKTKVSKSLINLYLSISYDLFICVFISCQKWHDQKQKQNVLKDLTFQYYSTPV